METVGTLGLKRKFEEVDSGSPFSTPSKDSDDDISSSDSADSCDSLNAPSSSFTRKQSHHTAPHHNTPHHTPELAQSQGEGD